MHILAAIRREEKKVRRQLANVQDHLSGLEQAVEALGESTNRGLKAIKRRGLSAKGRAAIAAAARKRWAKVRAQAKKR